MSALFQALERQVSGYYRPDISPIECELNRHFEGIDREEVEQEWRDNLLGLIGDYDRELFHGALNEFLRLVRDGRYAEAKAMLKRADEAYIRRMKETAPF